MFFALILQVSTGNLCGSFSCVSFGDPAPNPVFQQCINQVGGFFELEVCQDLYYSYCSPQYTNTYCSLPPETSDINFAYVGEPCILDRNCLDSICVNGFCKGLQVNMTCQTNTQCDVGLFCNNSRCVSLGQVNDPCNDDSDCDYDLGCYFNYCTEYFSLGAGNSSFNCNLTTNQDFLCQSGACLDNGFGQLICVGQIQTQGSIPKLCNNNADCMIGNNNPQSTFSTICNCGYNYYSNSFCNLAPGDPQYILYISYMQQWIKSKNNTNCSSSRKFDMACVQTYANSNFYITLNYYQNYVMYFPQIVDNDQCIMDIYTNSYWKAYYAYQAIQPNPTPISGSVYFAINVFLLALI